MRSIRFAFHRTIPVMFGYLFLGMAYGILLQNAGYGAGWAFLTSLVIYAGSMQFILVGFLSSGISLVSAALTTLSVNSRHIFYGISFIDTFKKMGRLRPYMIFSLSDETYSLLCGTDIPDGCDQKKVLFFMAFFDQCYWIAGSVAGALLGEVIPFDTTGIDFSMTALFVVIFVEQWLSSSNHTPAIIGLLCGILCLVFLGSSRFLLPALIITVALLILWKNTSAKKEVSL